MKDRIKKIRKALGLTQQEFADRLGISRGNIATYETRDGNPGSSVITLICREFNVSETWLRTGEGEMFVQRSEADEISAAVERLLSGESADLKRRMIIALSSLSDEHWALLDQKLREIVGLRNSTPTAEDAEAFGEEVKRLAMQQFSSEKKPELQASSANDTAGA